MFKTISLIMLLLFVTVFIAYCLHLQSQKPVLEEDEIPISISSGRYKEFLRESLVIELVIKDHVAWIYLTNKSDRYAIPAEEPHRSIVCTTEILDAEGKKVGSSPYLEYFKPAPPAEMGKMPSHQIPPKETMKLGYDLTVPHGTVQLTVTYEDFSKLLTGQAQKLLLTRREVKF